MATVALLLCSLLAVTAALPDDIPQTNADVMYDNPELNADVMYDNPELNAGVMYDNPTADMMYYEELPDAAVAEDVIPENFETTVEEVIPENVETTVEDMDVEIERVHRVQMYQFYQPRAGRFYYTTNHNEPTLKRYGFLYRGITCRISRRRLLGMVPLYRLFNKAGGHVYTTSKSEVRSLLTRGHMFGGPVVRNGPRFIGYCYSAPKRGTVPLIRWTQGKLPKYYTIYTTNNTPENISFMKGKGYSYSGITCYVFP